jgi:hypothetical protein
VAAGAAVGGSPAAPTGACSGRRCWTGGAGRGARRRRAAELAVALHDVASARRGGDLRRWTGPTALLSLRAGGGASDGSALDAPVCTLLAWIAYGAGDGARANVALDRALGTDPEYSLAVLLRQALDGGVTPREVRRTLLSTRRAISGARRRR